MTRALLIVPVLWLVSCTLDPKCDPGQRYELGSCLPDSKSKPNKPKDAGSEPVDDADGGGDAPDAATSDSGANCKPGPGNYEGFGRSCRSDADCTSCVAPTCATAPINQCSRVQCKGDPTACPPGWTCTDISAFSMNPDVTHICLKM